LQTFGRGDEDQMKPFDAGRLVEEVGRFVHELFPRAIRTQTAVAPVEKPAPEPLLAIPGAGSRAGG
jgi:hypothetical protein